MPIYIWDFDISKSHWETPHKMKLHVFKNVKPKQGHKNKNKMDTDGQESDCQCNVMFLITCAVRANIINKKTWFV